LLQSVEEKLTPYHFEKKKLFENKINNRKFVNKQSVHKNLA